METDIRLQAIRLAADIRGEVLDFYYQQEDLNSDTSKGIMRLAKRIDNLSNLLAFGPGKGHNESRMELQ